MIISILNDALEIKDQPAEILQQYLHDINLNIFDPIFYNCSSLTEAKQKILYILCAYSEDSPLLILRQDSKEEKEGICEYLQMPDFLRSKLYTLEELEVRRAATEYLTRFAGPLFRTMMFLRIQYDDQQLAITNKTYSIKKTEELKDEILTKTETFDNKEHGIAIRELAKLGKEIAFFEKEIKATGTYRAINEMREYKAKNIDKKIGSNTTGLSVEGSRLIKIGIHATGTNG